MTRSVLVYLASLCVISGCSTPRRTMAPGSADAEREPTRRTSSANELNARGLRLMHSGAYDAAEQALRQALAADVMHGAAHNNLGKIYFRQGKLYLAAWEFQYAIKLLPRQPEPRNNLGLVFEEVGKLEDAVTWYGAAVGLEPDNPLLIGNLARARVRRGDKDADLSSLLQKLVSIDSRPEWLAWAKQMVVLLHFSPADNQGVGDPSRGKD